MEDQCTRNCQRFYESMIQLRTKIDCFNSLTGLAMFVKVGSDALIVAGCLCAFAAGGLDPIVMASLSCYVVSCMCDIVFSCRASQLVINSMTKLCKAIDQHIGNHTITEYDYRQLQLITTMKRSFQFQVLNLFDLKDVTILIIIGYVTNYAVILVQTQPKP